METVLFLAAVVAFFLLFFLPDVIFRWLDRRREEREELQFWRTLAAAEDIAEERKEGWSQYDAPAFVRRRRATPKAAFGASNRAA